MRRWVLQLSWGLPWQACGGVQLHVTDRHAFSPVLTATALLQSAWSPWPQDAQWRTEVYEFIEDPIAIDLLGGSSALRHEIETGVPLSEVRSRWQGEVQPFADQRQRLAGQPRAVDGVKTTARGAVPRSARRCSDD